MKTGDTQMAGGNEQAVVLAKDAALPAIDRRSFLRTVGVAGMAATEFRRGFGQTAFRRRFHAVLVDTTRCEGCRVCEYACAAANGLPDPPDDIEGLRTTTDTQWSVVNEIETDSEAVEDGHVYVKRQCMHCIQPACASACLTKAMLKTEEGPVVWRGNKCMGCRFCMVSCPFRMPKFEYDSPNPRIRKCNMCAERLSAGELPACVEACPSEAIQFGRRSELIDEARRRISEEPDKYVHAIYGEHEVGGTCWLYLSAIPFEELGLPTKLGTASYPSLTKEFLYAVPVALILVPAFLLALHRATKRDDLPPLDGANDERFETGFDEST